MTALALINLAGRLRRGLVARTYDVYQIAVVTAPTPPPPPAQVLTRPGVLENLRAWRASHPALPAPFHSDRTQGWRHFCWAWTASEPVGIAWITLSSPLVQLEPDEAAIVDLYTAPAYRGRGIGALLVATACIEMRHLGVRFGYATVERDNVPSRRAFEAAGFSRLGSFTSRRLLHRKPSTLLWAR
jgi:ribosomal protein S18 acetylase RimI-like enzyme